MVAFGSPAALRIQKEKITECLRDARLKTATLMSVCRSVCEWREVVVTWLQNTRYRNTMDQYPQSTRETVTMILEKEYDADDNVIYRITKILPATSCRSQITSTVSFMFPAFYNRTVIAMKLLDGLHLLRSELVCLHEQ